MEDYNGHWTIYRWCCINCGKVVLGIKDQHNHIKVICPDCGTTMVRRILTKTHDTFDVYAPKGQ